MGVNMMNGGGEGGAAGDWEDWRRGENLIPNLMSKFYDQQTWTDVVFHLADGSSVRAHKLILAISSPVFEGMFYGPMADQGANEFKVEDVKPVGFRRLVQFVYTSRSMSWKAEEPEEWWHILEAANKYLNTRLVEQIESKLREISKKEAGKGVILRHLNMATRCSFETNVKSVFLNSVIKNTSKLIQSEMWGNLDEQAIMTVYNQEFLAANEGELYVGAKSWCLRNTSTQQDALKMFLDKFASKIIPEYMSQRDFLLCVANDAFLSQVDVFRDWTIKIMVKNAEDNTIRGSYRPMRIVEFFFNAKQHKNPVNPIQFTTESAVIDFQEETTKYTATLTSILDGDSCGLHLNLKTESNSKPLQGNKPLNFVRPGPKSTKLQLPNLPEMMSDEEVQKYARKSAILIAKMKDGSFKSEIMLNLDDAGSGFTSRNMFQSRLMDIDHVQVMVAIDARPSFKVSVISHKQFVEFVGSNDVPARDVLEEADFAREFEFRVDTHNMESAEKEICRTLKLKDCQAWYVNDENKCRKRDIQGMDNDLSCFLRYDAIYKMMDKVKEEISNAKGRAGYTGKGGDEGDKFIMQLSEEQKKYKAPHFWIMLEKEFKDDRDKLVSSVCKYDSTSRKLNYCGTICLQMQEEVTLKPTAEFFSMILYNSDPNSKVYLRRFLNPLIVTKVSPSDDIEGMNNFDIFIIQEGAKTLTDEVIKDYDKFIVDRINEIKITCRPRSEMDDRIFPLTVDKNQGIRFLKHAMREHLEVSLDAPLNVWECMSSEAASNNPLKKKSYRKPLDYQISEDDERKIKDLFSNCETGDHSIFYQV
eukprot:TRINITY_DN7102_c0_g1_i2.p1 TRINITY_DN7102_c0_g1~~TRINITY_DN7102_c0_g1_i2.p1  ORF type:complete len:813 (-),score=304.37 TRINITY_DN7102_c0_g1_i2:88-2526(-)